MMIVVTGSRTWRDKGLLVKTLDDLHVRYTVEGIIHGGATGADTMAGQWAQQRGLPEIIIPYASAYGKGGGAVRNSWLLQFGAPDLVLAFPTAESVGTWNCVTQAKQRGLNIRIIHEPAAPTTATEGTA